MKIIPYGKQFIDKKDIESVLVALKKDIITTGSTVKKFENDFEKLWNDRSEKCKVIQLPNAYFVENIYPSAKDMVSISFKKYLINEGVGLRD